MKTIAIVGASGYIGRHLVTELLRIGGWRIKVLSRTERFDFDCTYNRERLIISKGDLLNPSSLEDFFEVNCTVINLVYLWKADEKNNLRAIQNLLDACTTAHIGRFIHCSTAAVTGRVSNNLITENTISNPITAYGITKLKIEEAIIKAARNSFDAIILRPTAVFGPEGEPLKKLAADLISGNRLKNYLKSSLFGKRRMNLVHISNVTAAILFLVKFKKHLSSEIFIVSDDDDPSNNFLDVEQRLMREFHIPKYRFRLSMPLTFLKILLISLGRNNVNPHCTYSSSKLLSLGFQRPVSFETGLTDYAKWYYEVYKNNNNFRDCS